jgi:hypothetical protein
MVVTPFIIERFFIPKIVVCVGGGEDSRFLASLGMTNTKWAKD